MQTLFPDTCALLELLGWHDNKARLTDCNKAPESIAHLQACCNDEIMMYSLNSDLPESDVSGKATGRALTTGTKTARKAHWNKHPGLHCVQRISKNHFQRPSFKLTSRAITFSFPLNRVSVLRNVRASTAEKNTYQGMTENEAKHPSQRTVRARKCHESNGRMNQKNYRS